MGEASDVALAESSIQPSGREGIQQEHGPTATLLFHLSALPHASGDHCSVLFYEVLVPCQVSVYCNVLRSPPSSLSPALGVNV